MRSRALFVFPVLFFLVAVLLTDAYGPYYLGNNLDPDYPYLLNSLNLLTFHIPGHTDHPGTTLQILGAMIALVRWFGSNIVGTWESLQRSILSKPEDYMHFINVVLNALLGLSVYMAGRQIYRMSGSIGAALILQGGCFLFVQLPLAMIRVSPEPLLVITGFLLAIPLAIHIFRVRSHASKEESQADYKDAIFIGAVVGFGLVTKMTFVPFLLFALLFKTTRTKVSFCVSVILTAAVLLIPVYPHIPRMTSWFASLLLHTGKYGSGPVGIQSPGQLITNLRSLLHSEPLLFLLPPYYVGVVAAAILGKSQDLPPHVSILKRFILLCTGSIAVGLAINSKSPVEHYMVPALMAAVLANAAVVVFIRDAGLSNRTRLLFVAGGVCLGVWGAYNAGTGLLARTRYFAIYRDEIRRIHSKLAELPDCTMIGYYRSSIPSYALFFGDDFSAGGQSSVLAELYPTAMQFNIWSGRINRFNKTVRLAEIRESIGSGHCYLMQGTVKLDTKYLKTLRGLLLEPVMEGATEGLYRLKGDPDFQLVSIATLPTGSTSIEAEDFATGDVERDFAYWGAKIGVIVSPRYPAYAEYHVNLAPGKYDMRIRYAADEPRPITVRVNGTVITETGASEATSGWQPKDQMWQAIGVVDLKASNVIRLEREGPFPHIDKIGFVPVALLRTSSPAQ